jgi:hypothetical protein
MIGAHRLDVRLDSFPQHQPVGVIGAVGLEALEVRWPTRRLKPIAFTKKERLRQDPAPDGKVSPLFGWNPPVARDPRPHLY